MNIRTFILAWLLVPAVGAADLIGSQHLPLSSEQHAAWNYWFGGTASSTTRGTYNPDSYVWTQVGNAGAAAVFGKENGQPTSYGSASISTILTGLVDNNGVVIGGIFAMFGMIDHFGVATNRLLAAGTLYDADYSVDSGAGYNLQALIELKFLAGPLQGIGDFLLWSSYAEIDPWGPRGPGDPDTSWQSPVAAADYSQYTGSSYYFYDRSVILPEPATLGLLITGLLLLAANRRRRSADQRA